MKKNIVSFSLCFFFSLCLVAQQNHFIYIQADNKQPFYVKLKDKVYSSSASGYIILSKLLENTYNLTIGFPKNEWPEQKLNVDIKKNDLGYLLKNFEEKGWGLVDMNSFKVLYNNSQINSIAASNPIAKVNEEKKEDIQPVEVKSQPQKETAQENKIEAPKNEAKKNVEPTIEKKVENTKLAIRKLFTSKSNNNLEIVYVVNNKASVDTVRVLLEGDETNSQILNEALPTKAVEANNNNQVAVSSKPVQVQTKNEIEVIPLKETAITPNVSKTNCKNVASEDEYKKLRKKMADAESDVEMVYRAQNVFKKHCFTTEQIKTLSFLFLNEEGKYKFLDAAYPYIADEQNFSKLVSLLSNEYYIKRFNAMLKN